MIMFPAGEINMCKPALAMLASLALTATLDVASRPGRLKYGLVSIAWVIVHMRELSSPESGEFVHVSKPL